MSKFTVGQKVAVVQVSGISEGYVAIRTIKAISPKRGDISLDKGSDTFDSDGRQKGAGYHPAYLEVVEQKHYDKIERNNALGRLHKFNFDSLSLEELRAINKIVQPHFEKLKAKDA